MPLAFHRMEPAELSDIDGKPEGRASWRERIKRPTVRFVTRREVAKIIGTATAGLMLSTDASRGKANSVSSATLARTIPSSGEKLPVIGLGTWRAFDVDLSADVLRQLEDVLSMFV